MDQGARRHEAEMILRSGAGHSRAPRVAAIPQGKEALIDGLLRLLPEGIFLCDTRELRPRRANPALCRMLGVSAARLCATGFAAHLVAPEDEVIGRLRAAIECGAAFGPQRLDLRRGDGMRLPVMLSAEPAHGHGGAARAWVRVAPLAGRLTEEELGEGADPLTGLEMRKPLLRRLRAEITAARAHERLGAVLLLDLDGFKDINTRHGDSIGDAFLAAQAQRLGEAMGEGGFAARLCGDEFAAVLPDVGTPRGAKLRALDISAAMSGAVVLGGATMLGSVSIGVSLYPDDSHDPDRLILNADAALYASKRAGGGVVTFHKPSASALHPVSARDRVRSDLARAQRNDELSLHFQPIVDLHSGQTLMFEALLRWRRGGAGQLSPQEFMRLAESNSAIDTLRRFTIEEALREQAQWVQRLGRPAGVCVNISPAQIASDAALEWMLGRIRRMPAPEALILEVTETTRFREGAQFERLAKLREAGVRIAIDDFGTGYSTLDYLARIPADYLKLDRSFIAGIEEEKYRRLLRASISLGKEFGMRIIAEGIETPKQATALRDLGCDMGQGYHFGAPAQEARPGTPR